MSLAHEPAAGLAARAGSESGGRALAVGAGVVAGLAALAVYLATQARTITFAHHGSDSGDLVTAAINLGVPHPTGYPLYTLVAHLFARLPWAEPAGGVTAFSGVAAAAAVAGVYALAYRALSGYGLRRGVRVATAWCAAGLLACSDLHWSQATIAEVYALHMLVVVGLLVLARRPPAPWRPYALALLFGVGLAHHLTVLLLLPALWPYAGAVRRWLSGRRALYLGLCLLPGLLAYLYIPLRAGASPMPNWGQAHTLQGLLWLITGAAYRGYVVAVGPAHLLQRLSAWAAIWVRNVTVPGLALALVGLRRGLQGDRRFTLLGLTYLLVLSVYALCYITVDSYLYLLPGVALFAVWAAHGIATLVGAAAGWLARPGAVARLGLAAAVAALALAPAGLAASRWQAMDLSRDRAAYAYAARTLGAARPNALLMANGDQQTFPLWYLRYGLQVRPDVTVVDRSLLAFAWYRRDVAAREPGLAALAAARSGEEAAILLVRRQRDRRPIHLAYPDGALFDVATWTHDGQLLTLARE